jgi:hypothetical protein
MPPDPEAVSRLGTTGQTVSIRVVSRDFLNAMRNRLIAGRGFTDRDGANEPQVMLINETLSRSRVINGEAVGTQFYLLGSVTFDPRRFDPNQTPRPWQIVGIVEDVRQASLDREPGPEVFVDFRQLPGPSGPPGSARYFAIRTDGTTPISAAMIRSTARQFDTQALIENVAPMEQLVSGSLARPRLLAALAGVFAGIAVMLAAVGIYGVTSYSVAQRTHEIGVRVALGAARPQVVKLVLAQTAGSIALGIAIGVGGAAIVTRFLQTMLFGLTPLDPSTFIGVSALFAAIATIAVLLPALRATRVDPLIALRTD